MSPQLHTEPNLNKRSRSELSRSSTPGPIDSDIEDLKASLPGFLKQSQAEIRLKFECIQEREEARYDSFRSDPEADPDHQWAQEGIQQTLGRNRYTDIIPWTQSRIHLKVPAGQVDYINASPISLLCSKDEHELHYIATQGPRAAGVDHFWQMVWHECSEVAVIVMLTRLNEGTKEKCFQYFPSADELPVRPPLPRQITPQTGQTLSPPPRTSTSSRNSNSDLSTATRPVIALKLTSDEGDEVSGSVTLIDTNWDEGAQAKVRKMCLVRGEESRIVYHLLFSGWPDYGVPQGKDKAALLKLIHLSNNKNDGQQEKSPRIVHCSAGVGRTGTFIALEHLIGELDRGAYDAPKATQKQDSSHVREADMDDDISTFPDPVFDTVSRLREQRPVMVQSVLQFLFIYEILTEEWLKRKRKLLEEKKHMGEPSPKAVRLGRGLKKILQLGRDRSSSRNGKAKPEAYLSRFEAKVVALKHPSDNLRTILGGLTGILIMYIVWRWS